MVERVDGVVIKARKREGIGGFLAVAHGVILIGAVLADDGGIRAAELAVAVVAPGDASYGGEGRAGLAEGAALADRIHGVVVARNHGAANPVFFHIQDVAVGLPCVSHRVGGTADLIEETGVRSVGIGEDLIGDLRI